MSDEIAVLDKDDIVVEDGGRSGMLILLVVLSITAMFLTFGVIYYWKKYQACEITNFELDNCPKLKCADGSEPWASGQQPEPDEDDEDDDT